MQISSSKTIQCFDDSARYSSIIMMCFFHRVFGSFTMETIIATAFGRVMDIQGGENDELTNAADLIFRGAAEGNKTSVAYVLPLTSKSFCVFSITLDIYIHVDNFPWLVPVLRFLMSRSQRVRAVETLKDTALSLINERRKSGPQGNVSVLLLSFQSLC